jgi:alpha-tubulin suppressor-like RCC1 family protein
VQFQVHRAFGCALLDDAQVVCWGANARGALGLGDTTARGGMAGTLAAISGLGTGRTAVSLALAAETVCAVLDNQRVKCWGETESALLDQMADNWGDEPDELGDALPYLDLGKP